MRGMNMIIAISVLLAPALAWGWTVYGAGGLAGPDSTTDNAVVRWDGTDGTAVQDSSVIIDDNGVLIINATNVRSGDASLKLDVNGNIYAEIYRGNYIKGWTSGGEISFNDYDGQQYGISINATGALGYIALKYNGTEKLYVSDAGIGFGTRTFGSNASGVLAIFNGTAPTSSPVDTVQVWAEDYAAGDTRLYIMGEADSDTVIIGAGELLLNGAIVLRHTIDNNYYRISFNAERMVFQGQQGFYFHPWTDRPVGNMVSFLPPVPGQGRLTASSGEQAYFSIEPAISQSGTAGYIGLLLDITETATGSGTKKLVDFRVGGASVYSINNAGMPTIGYATDCSGYISEGQMCWDSDDDILYVGTGTAVVPLN